MASHQTYHNDVWGLTVAYNVTREWDPAFGSSFIPYCSLTWFISFYHTAFLLFLEQATLTPVPNLLVLSVWKALIHRSHV